MIQSGWLITWGRQHFLTKRRRINGHYAELSQAVSCFLRYWCKDWASVLWAPTVRKEKICLLNMQAKTNIGLLQAKTWSKIQMWKQMQVVIRRWQGRLWKWDSVLPVWGCRAPAGHCGILSYSSLPPWRGSSAWLENRWCSSKNGGHSDLLQLFWHSNHFDSMQCRTHVILYKNISFGLDYFSCSYQCENASCSWRRHLRLAPSVHPSFLYSLWSQLIAAQQRWLWPHVVITQ